MLESTDVSLFVRLSFCLLGANKYLGIISTSQPTMRELETKEDAVSTCSDMKFLAPKQRQLCRESNEKKLLQVISNGASVGINECQHQFSTRRWNCSTFNSTDVFGGILRKKSRETAYIYAISSAGVMHSITRACAKGELDHCGCDVKVRRKDTAGQFEWGGCSENIRYGAKFSREFVDSKEERKSASQLMNLWNNEAGRKAIKNQMELVCKCHGVSASCSVKICWRKMRNFRLIGQFLKDKFDGASLVKYNKRKNKLKRRTRDMKKPTKKDLVYLEESPDFCEYDLRSGSLGTKGRQCDKDSLGIDGCTLMCCGRGYYTIVRELKEDCDCKFVWCCRVDCKKCSQRVELHYCN
ncbi:hypothetical protein FSP39_016897 [Pinctada imbricata]|uniref:Protein Wnt n=1 Tax=Pinctada imbricata TaxID=66713 RepID=A0AA89C3U0_PINIB|nr:hypothetical protein FSP39_016897 [Pinctada imbricata]